MQNDNLTPEEVAEDRDRFYIYTDYEEQLKMLTDEQIGRVFMALYHYFHTGEKLVQEQEVNMMLSFMTSKLDKDAKYYARKVERRREAGRKGGEASARKREQKRLAEEANQANVEIVNDCQRFQADKDKEKDKDKEQDKEQEKDRDKEKEREEENKLNYYYYSSSNSTEPPHVDNSALILYGREQYPTTRAEVEKIHTLADELLHTYRGKKPTPDDYEKVFGYVHTIAVTEDGEHYGIYSGEKANLLRHVFDEASLRSDMSWQYISRIYLNYEQHNVNNVEEAIEYEGKWKRGEIA